ncbi:MAG: carbohydrate ABC transporter permease [Clostridia bacterium]|nr:carbohydrate ABC transporter permease [Clostridia bacterium]
MKRFRLSISRGRLLSHSYDIVVFILLVGLSFVFLYPFLHMFSTSLKSYDDLTDITVKWFPKNLTPSNYAVAFDSLNYLRSFGNSLIVSLTATVGHILSCSFIAYGFARFKFPLKKLLFGILVLAIVVPLPTIIVPQYRMFSSYGVVNQQNLLDYTAILLPTFFGFGLRGCLFTYLFRQTFIKLPSALEEAAAIDGCNPFKTFFRIVIPSSGAVILVVAVLSMVWHWNDAYEPNLYIVGEEYFLLPQLLPGLKAVIDAMSSNPAEPDAIRTYNDAVAMAGTALAALPMLLMFFTVRNKFMQSIERTGLVE